VNSCQPAVTPSTIESSEFPNGQCFPCVRSPMHSVLLACGLLSPKSGKHMRKWELFAISFMHDHSAVKHSWLCTCAGINQHWTRVCLSVWLLRLCGHTPARPTGITVRSGLMAAYSLGQARGSMAPTSSAAMLIIASIHIMAIVVHFRNIETSPSISFMETRCAMDAATLGRPPLAGLAAPAPTVITH
jgi:hypothetical protein